MADILHRVGIRSSAEKVSAALWSAKNVKASTEVGTMAQFRFGDHGFNDMKVVELSSGKRVK